MTVILRTPARRSLDDIRVYHTVVVGQRPLMFEASHDSANARGGVEDIIWATLFELGECGGRIDEIAIGPLQRDDVPVAFSAQVVDERGPHQAGA
jgi:hypothetical protein